MTQDKVNSDVCFPVEACQDISSLFKMMIEPESKQEDSIDIESTVVVTRTPYLDNLRRTLPE